jgi:iron complex outermembrane recepter protein
VRAFIGFGNDESTQSIDFLRAVVGLRGALLKTGWDYDVNFSHSESKGKYTFQSFLTDRMTQSTAVVANGNGFSCLDTSNGCVAAPALTPAVIGGQLPADWVNYVFVPVTGVSKYKEDVLSATVTGKVMQLPYGAMKAAVGAEVRSYSIDDTPPLDAQNGNLYNLTSATPTRGNDNVKEIFGELEVPLLANLPFAQQLTANVSGRWADYKSYGSGSTYKFGTLWSPAKWLTLRGTTGTSYRAPALYEQYLGATSGFLSQQNDPCNNWDAASNAGTTRAANCASEGLPAGFNATSSIRVLNSGGAAAGLKAETSNNHTFGLIFQPSLPTGMGDLSLAVDFFSIKVNNGVSRAGALNILSLCYDDPQFRAGGGFCRLVDARDPSSNQLTVNDSYVNLATDIVKGRDYTARYTNDLGIGKLRVNLSLVEFRSQANKLFADDPLDEVNGTIGSPKWSGTLDVNYDVKGWRFYYGLNYVGKMSSYDYYGEDPATSTYKLNTPEYFTHTASIGYKADKWDVTVGVRNLTNEKPPVISAQAGYNRVGNAPLYSGYDYVGRRFYLNASKSF